MKRYFAAFVFCAGLFSFAPRMAAQAVYGSIVGTVTDASSSAVPTAKVIITDLDRQVTNNAEANANGNYLQRSLIAGRYRVRVEAPGFKAFQQDNVAVSVDAEVRVDARLEVGDASQTVEVTTEAGLVKTERSDVATTYQANTITTIPLAGRRFTQLMVYVPGNANPTNGLAISGEAAGLQPGANTYMNGQRNAGSGYMLDGTDHHDAILSIIVFQPTLESLVETKVTTNAYDAEIGNAAAGVVSAQTKSGTNTLHGSLFEFTRNSNQQARSPFAQSRLIPNSNRAIPVGIWNQFGGSVGGAIIKNKLFYFGDYQGTRRVVGGSTLARVPTLAERGNPALGIGADLRGLGPTRRIFDPLSNNNGPPATRLEFPNQIIPAARLSPQAQNLLKSIPLPNLAGATFDQPNFVGSGSSKEHQDQVNVRTDYFATDKFHVFGRYSIAEFDLNAPGIFGPVGGGRGYDPAGGIGGTSVLAQNHHISIAGGGDYVVSPSLFTDFRFGFFRYNVVQRPPTGGTNAAKAAGIPGLNNDEFSSHMPGMSIQDYSFLSNENLFKFGNSLTTSCNCPLDQNEKQIQFVNNWTKVGGNHTIKFGADIRRAYNLRAPSDRGRAGDIFFFGARTQGPTAPGTVGGGSGLATFLLGDVSQLNRYVGGTVADNLRERQNRWFFFAQDTWKITRKLTFNYGLRWEIYKPQTVNAAGHGGNLDLATGEVYTYGMGDYSLSGNIQNNYKLFAPRVGLAYQWDSKTVIRAGYGRGFSMGTFGSIFGHSVTQNLPVLASQTLVGANNFDAAFTLASGPGVVLDPHTVLKGQPLGPHGLPILPNGQTMFVNKPKLELGSIDSWNFTVQRQLTGTSALEVAYVANIGTHVYASNPDYDPNQPGITGFGVLSQSERKPFFVQACATCPNGRLGWTQNFRYFGNDATARYQSLQVKYDKRFSHGIQMGSHFTFSKAIDYDNTYFPRDAKVAKGLATGSRPKAFFLYATYDLPFGKGRMFGSNWSKPVDMVLGGWQTNYVWSWFSGLPLTPSYQNCSGDQDVGICRPNRIGDSKIDNQTKDHWFATVPTDSSGNVIPMTVNGQAYGPWGRPLKGQLGNSGRNWFMFGPQFQQLDASFFKNFSITEKFRLQLRAESFNFANHTNLGNPDTCVDCPGRAGKILAVFPGYSPRLWQFALRLDF